MTTGYTICGPNKHCFGCYDEAGCDRGARLVGQQLPSEMCYTVEKNTEPRNLHYANTSSVFIPLLKLEGAPGEILQPQQLSCAHTHTHTVNQSIYACATVPPPHHHPHHHHIQTTSVLLNLIPTTISCSRTMPSDHMSALGPVVGWMHVSDSSSTSTGPLHSTSGAM